MMYVPPFWLKIISLVLIFILAIFTPNWLLFFLVAVPLVIIVHHGWKVENPSNDDRDWPDAIA